LGQGSLEREKGATGTAMADRMGHTSEAMGEKHYEVALGISDQTVLGIFEEIYRSVMGRTDSIVGPGAN
jgi:hypothetical protein